MEEHARVPDRLVPTGLTKVDSTMNFAFAEVLEIPFFKTSIEQKLRLA